MKLNCLEPFSLENITKYSGDTLLDYLRSSLVNLYLVVFVFLATIAVLASVARALDTGWLPLYTAQIIMIAIAWIITIFRHRVKSTHKALVLIIFLLIAGIGGYLQFGLAVQNSYLFFLAIFFSALMLPIKTTIAFSIFSILSFTTMIVLFLSGMLEVDIDVVSYTQAPTTQIVKIVSFIFIVAVVFFTLSWIIKLLVEVLNSLHAKSTELQYVALHDNLTGLYNRHSFTEKGNAKFERAKRDGNDMSVIMCDIDHFKAVNDTYGHHGGDKVLQQMGILLRSNRRAEDFVARYGGEEFVLVLEHCDAQEAKNKAEEIRITLSRLAIDNIYVTASFGVAQINNEHKDFEALLKDADEALYRAKESGRNRTVIYSNLI